ncbi:hypothetical protein EVAR_65950_1 [Eumeta japonica]|uniref:Uncharacterized protein n=1 Tax=Eumeta variegata TaxID=151549 RepID=A0A4C1ZMU7_EUMVA|nr:hypothetical protein EVAR_65950_1 [Eumeta japonica]
MRRAQARQSYIFRYVVILLRVYWRKVTRARRTASADWWITPGTAGMRPRDLFTTSRDYRESVGPAPQSLIEELAVELAGFMTWNHLVSKQYSWSLSYHRYRGVLACLSSVRLPPRRASSHPAGPAGSRVNRITVTKKLIRAVTQ